MSTAEIPLPSVPETEELATTKIPLPSVPETAALGITLLGASSETPRSRSAPLRRSRRSPPADLRRLLQPASPPPAADLRHGDHSSLHHQHPRGSPPPAADLRHGDHNALHHQHPPRIRIGYPPLLHVFVGIVAFCLNLHQTHETHGGSFSLFALVVVLYRFLLSHETHETRAGPG
jgi:hypothetical protein